MKGLSGKLAVITGGASGLGAGLSRKFAEVGVTVVIVDILEDQGTKLQREIGKECLFLRTDLRSDEDIDRLVSEIDSRFGHLDFLLNVACSYAEAGLNSTRQQWQAVFDINLFGHAVLIQKCLPLLKRSTGPSIVNFASSSGRIAQMGRWVYPATKAATEQLTRSAALELAEHGVRINALLPGMVAKKPGESTSPDVSRRMADLSKRANIQSRLQDPDEIAEAAMFLCSSYSRSMTGSTLVADSGCIALGPLGKEVHIPKRNPAP